MSMMATFTPSTAQSMCGKIVHFLPKANRAQFNKENKESLQHSEHNQLQIHSTAVNMDQLQDSISTLHTVQNVPGKVPLKE